MDVDIRAIRQGGNAAAEIVDEVAARGEGERVTLRTGIDCRVDVVGAEGDPRRILLVERHEARERHPVVGLEIERTSAGVEVLLADEGSVGVVGPACQATEVVVAGIDRAIALGRPRAIVDDRVDAVRRPKGSVGQPARGLLVSGAGVLGRDDQPLADRVVGYGITFTHRQAGYIHPGPGPGRRLRTGAQVDACVFGQDHVPGAVEGKGPRVGMRRRIVRRAGQRQGFGGRRSVGLQNHAIGGHCIGLGIGRIAGHIDDAGVLGIDRKGQIGRSLVPGIDVGRRRQRLPGRPAVLRQVEAHQLGAVRIELGRCVLVHARHHRAIGAGRQPGRLVGQDRHLAGRDLGPGRAVAAALVDAARRRVGRVHDGV